MKTLYNLTSHVQSNNKGKDNKRRTFILYFLNDILIFKHKRPFDETMSEGFNGRWYYKNTFILNNTLYQTRYDKKESRDVKFPISKKILEQFRIPKDHKIYL